MKRIGIVALLCCMFSLCFALTGCGGGESSSSSSASADDGASAKAAFAGTWDLTGLVRDGQETSKQDIESLTNLGYEVYLNLNEDGTSKLSLFDRDPVTGTWEASSATAGTITMQGSTIDMTIEGDTLTVAQNNSSMTFKKGSARNPAASASSASAEAASSEAAEPVTDEATEEAGSEASASAQAAETGEASASSEAA